MDWQIGDIVKIPLSNGRTEYGEIIELNCGDYLENPWVVISLENGSNRATYKTMKKKGVEVIWRPISKE